VKRVFAGVRKRPRKIVENLRNGGEGITEKMRQFLPESGKINVDVQCFIGATSRFFHLRLIFFAVVAAIFPGGAAAFLFGERNRGSVFHLTRVFHKAHTRAEGNGRYQHQKSQYFGTENAHDTKISIVC